MKEQMSVNVSGEGVVVSPGKVRNGNNGVPDANNGKEMISDSELAKIQAINKVSLKDRIKSYKRTPGSLILFLLVSLATLFTAAMLVFLIAYILVRGVPYLTPSLFAWEYTSDNCSVVPALINTVLMVLLALLIAVPFGIFSAVYLVEYAGKGNKLVKVIRVTAETLTGIPSIVYGLFGMLFFVNALKWNFSLLAGAFTLSIMILPVILRTTEADVRTGFLQRRQLRPGGGQTAHRIPDRTALRGARHSLRRYPGYRTYRGGDGGADLHSRFGGKTSQLRVQLHQNPGRSYVQPVQ